MSTGRQVHAPGDDVIRAKTLRGLLLARALDANRIRHGLSTRMLAAKMRMSPAMCNRIMTGRRVPTSLEVGGLCALLDVPADRRPRLYELARSASATDWLIHHPGDTHVLNQIEAEARTVTEYRVSLLPGSSPPYGQYRIIEIDHFNRSSVSNTFSQP